MRGAQGTVQQTTLVAFYLQLFLLPLGGRRQILQTLQRAFFQARPERHISAVKPSLSILKKLSHLKPSLVHISRLNVTRRYFPHALPEKFSTFASASLLHVWQTQQHHRWHASPTGLSRKTNSTNGVANKSRSLEGYDRWLSITLQCRSALTKSTQQGHRP